MGELGDDHIDTLDTVWAGMLAHAEAFPCRPESRATATHLRRRPPPPNLTRAPMILATDIGDPEAAIATALAALHIPELALVITADRPDGEAARALRHLLNLTGRDDVTVVSGSSAPGNPEWALPGPVPSGIGTQPDDPIEAVAAVAAEHSGLLRWVGTAALTDLAHALTSGLIAPDRLHINQVGGLPAAAPGHVGCSFAQDPSAAAAVLARASNLRLVGDNVASTVTIARGDDAYGQLTTPDAPAWARLLRTQLDRRFDRTGRPALPLRATLTLTAGCQSGFVAFNRRHPFDLTGTASVVADPHGGHSPWVAVKVEQDLFRRWLNRSLT